MKKTLIAVLLALAFGAFSGYASRGYVPEIRIHAANYTEEYIHDFYVTTADGKHLGIGGVSVKQFSNGGANLGDCCASTPGVGQSIRAVWRTGNYNDPESKWTTHTATVILKGETSDDPDTLTYLILRFF
jgi:hypothetical protein